MDGSTMAAVGAAACAALGVIGSIYSHISKLKDNVLTGKVDGLTTKVDAHFEMQKDTLGRVDRNMDMTTKILEKHMEMLTEHDSRLAVTETEVRHLHGSHLQPTTRGIHTQ